MTNFIKSKTCPKCNYTGSVDCWTNSHKENICKCPVCKTTFKDISKKST